MTFIVSPEAESLYFVCASIRSANVLTLQLSGDKSAESLLIFCDRLKNRVFPGRHNLFINVAPGFEVLFVLSHGLFCCRQTINVRGKLNVPAVRRLTEKKRKKVRLFSCRRRKVQEFNIQEKLSVLHSRGQCRGSVAAESSRYSTFSSVFL